MDKNKWFTTVLNKHAQRAVIKHSCTEEIGRQAIVNGWLWILLNVHRFAMLLGSLPFLIVGATCRLCCGATCQVCGLTPEAKTVQDQP